MTCCEPTIYPFNGSSLTIEYGPVLEAQYGADPNVQVYIKDGDEYVLSDDGNQIIFTGSAIEIDFGGPAMGFAKVF